MEDKIVNLIDKLEEIIVSTSNFAAGQAPGLAEDIVIKGMTKNLTEFWVFLFLSILSVSLTFLCLYLADKFGKSENDFFAPVFVVFSFFFGFCFFTSSIIVPFSYIRYATIREAPKAYIADEILRSVKEKNNCKQNRRH